jgi:nucleoside-triphosphatase THEP1
MEIQETEKQRRNLLSKISKAKNKLGEYPVNVVAIAKQANDKLVNIVQLQDQRKQLEY